MCVSEGGSEREVCVSEGGSEREGGGEEGRSESVLKGIICEIGLEGASEAVSMGV